MTAYNIYIYKHRFCMGLPHFQISNVCHRPDVLPARVQQCLWANMYSGSVPWPQGSAREARDFKVPLKQFPKVKSCHLHQWHSVFDVWSLHEPAYIYVYIYIYDCICQSPDKTNQSNAISGKHNYKIQHSVFGDTSWRYRDPSR